MKKNKIINIEKILSVKSKEELIEIGTIKEIVESINGITSPLQISCNDYDNVFETIGVLKNKYTDFIKGPFISKEKEYEFYLTKLDGENREKCLGISDEHYENKKIAKKWYKNIAKIVHSDATNNDDNFAFLKLTEIYENMIDYEEGEGEINER